MRKLALALSIIASTAILASPLMAFQEVGDYPSGRLEVRIWLNEHNGTVFRPGEQVGVFFQASRDCYVVVYDVDTQGFVNILYPKHDDMAWVQGERIYQVPDPHDEYNLVVDGPRGIEYVVAVASPYPLNLRTLFAEDEDWGSYAYRGRITGDPHLAISDLNERLAWGNGSYSPEGYASDIGWFYVERRVPYPRYLVYHWYSDCFFDPWWDPYDHVTIFIDFHWDHRWCRSWWWCSGCRPAYHYWYIDSYSGRRCKWKSHYRRDEHRPYWFRQKHGGPAYREKPARDYRTKAPRLVSRDESGWRRVREIGRRVKGIVERDKAERGRSARVDSRDGKRRDGDRRDERRRDEKNRDEKRRQDEKRAKSIEREQKQRNDDKQAKPARQEQERKRSDRDDSGKKKRDEGKSKRGK